MKQNDIVKILVLIFFVSLILPPLITDEMFMDGVTYASISRNLANGLGTVFSPHYTQVLYPEFFEHPPLVFAIQSIFFSIFGNNLYVERIYTLLTAFITALGIIKIWKLFVNQNLEREFYWFPIMLWISVPMIYWTLRNNMLENTMGIFTVFAVFFISKSMLTGKYVLSFLGSFMIYLAILSKGPVGLFPLVIPLIYGLTFKKNHSIIFTHFLILIFLLFILFCSSLLIVPDLKLNLLHYLEQQLIPALKSTKAITVRSRFDILLKLLISLLIPFIFLVAVLAIKKINKGKIDLKYKKESIYFLLIGISASFPITLTLKQQGFYLVPSIPYFILAICFVLVPIVFEFVEKLNQKVIFARKALIIIIPIIVIYFGIKNYHKNYGKNTYISDIKEICEIVPYGSTISAEKSLCSDWKLIAYLSRIGNLSLDCDHQTVYKLERKNRDTKYKQIYPVKYIGSEFILYVK